MAVKDLELDKITAETQKVWQEHIDSWDARDLDGIMVHYREDSIFVGNNTVYRGVEAIRGVFTHLFDLFSKGGNLIEPAVIEGELIYILWNFTPTGDNTYFGTDTFIVRNGIITYQTVASILYDNDKYKIRLSKDEFIA